MSSHREAPEIVKDPVADSTDLYGFVSPDRPDTVTIIANYIPLEAPAGGPNFDNFGDDVLYEIHISNSGTAMPDITYQFQFTTQVMNPNTFLYNSGPIMSLDDPNWNVRQVYSVSRITADGRGTMLASGLRCPPCNVGVRSTPNYAALAQAAISRLPSGEMVFAGQRSDAFFVDLGSIFDLGDIRPIQHLHLISMADAVGVDTIRGHNVHSIVIQVPMRLLTVDGSMPTDPASPTSVIGMWTTASRRKATIRGSSDNGVSVQAAASGPWVQVSRLGNPLTNEVVIPIGKKDYFNSQPPSGDAQFVQYIKRPELAKLLPVLYPNTFPNLNALNNNPDPSADRADLVAVLATGIPSGIVPGFQNNTGMTPADMLRLNMAIPLSQNPSPFGLLAGDPGGYPNGRRVLDDVISIALRAVAGATYALVNPSFTPDAAVMQLTGGVSSSDNPVQPTMTFPYLADPLGGFQEIPPSTM